MLKGKFTMGKALGFFEISGVVAAVNALDIMCKTWEKKRGGRLVTIIVRGNVSAVKEAIDAAAENGIKKPVGKAVIANPHEEIEKMVKKSADRLAKSKGWIIEDDGESFIKEV